MAEIQKKRLGSLSSAFEKADSQWKYIFEDQEKIPQKTWIYIISPICFHPTAKKMALAIGQQRRILKIQNHPRRLLRPCMVVYQHISKIAQSIRWPSPFKCVSYSILLLFTAEAEKNRRRWREWGLRFGRRGNSRRRGGGGGGGRIWHRYYLHCKKRLAIFPSPAGMSLTKLSLNYSWPESVVGDIPAGDGKIAYLFFTV